MPNASWNANPGGEYWIDVRLGSRSLPVLVDTGLIDVRGEVGFSVDHALYDAIKITGEFVSFQRHGRMSADGTVRVTESGALDVQLFSPQTKIPVGPVVHLFVMRGSPGVPDRVGLAFFHLLKGCKILWDLDQRLWQVECP